MQPQTVALAPWGTAGPMPLLVLELAGKGAQKGPKLKGKVRVKPISMPHTST